MKRKDFDFDLAKSIHRNFYSYDRVICLGIKKKVIITCPKHGDFSQTPYCHIVRKQGCSKCQYENQKKQQTFTKEQFTQNANAAHDNKYCYENVNYVNSNTKVNIKCNLHGFFTQTPANHVNQKKGCPKCKSEKLSQINTLSTKDFIAMSKSIHGLKYDYSYVNYTGMKNSVEIICPQHGSFMQKAGNHIYIKNGCPKCGYNTSNAETEWLDSLNVPKKYRQKTITIQNIRYKVDAFDISTNTIYEYFGSFWHGNPDYYSPDDINPKNGINFGVLYENTIKKINHIKNAGYNLIFIWGK